MIRCSNLFPRVFCVSSLVNAGRHCALSPSSSLNKDPAVVELRKKVQEIFDRVETIEREETVEKVRKSNLYKYGFIAISSISIIAFGVGHIDSEINASEARLGKRIDESQAGLGKSIDECGARLEKRIDESQARLKESIDECGARLDECGARLRMQMKVLEKNILDKMDLNGSSR